MICTIVDAIADHVRFDAGVWMRDALEVIGLTDVGDHGRTWGDRMRCFQGRQFVDFEIYGRSYDVFFFGICIRFLFGICWFFFLYFLWYFYGIFLVIFGIFICVVFVQKSMRREIRHHFSVPISVSILIPKLP